MTWTALGPLLLGALAAVRGQLVKWAGVRLSTLAVIA
jgi:hypothetical protein